MDEAAVQSADRSFRSVFPKNAICFVFSFLVAIKMSGGMADNFSPSVVLESWLEADCVSRALWLLSIRLSILSMARSIALRLGLTAKKVRVRYMPEMKVSVMHDPSIKAVDSGWEEARS